MHWRGAIAYCLALTPLSPACLAWRQPEDGEPAAGNSDEASSSGQAEPGTVASLRVLRDPSSALQPAAVHSNAVCGVALSSDGARLCSGGNDLQVRGLV